MNVPKILAGNEALSRFIDVWLDGFVSGIQTMLANHGVPDGLLIAISQQMATDMRHDPAAMHLVEQNVLRSLAGEVNDFTPQKLTVARVTRCTCDPRHLDVGGYDPGCPRHDRTTNSKETDQ